MWLLRQVLEVGKTLFQSTQFSERSSYKLNGHFAVFVQEGSCSLGTPCCSCLCSMQNLLVQAKKQMLYATLVTVFEFTESII